MKAWKIDPTGDIAVIPDINRSEAIDRASSIVGGDVELTYVFWTGKRCTMAVDDQGSRKELAVNRTATQAYLQACRPGAQYEIVGTTVIFDGVLS